MLFATTMRRRIEMVRVTAFPTIEWLTDRAARPLDIEPISSACETGGSNTATAIAAQLTEGAEDETSICADAWIQTPNGEEHVGIVLRRCGRRIGIRFSARYERDTDQRDALVLVYGSFDMIYRVRCPEPGAPVHDVVYAIEMMHPTWFSNAGRLSAGRDASVEAVMNSDLLASVGSIQLPGSSIRRIRLSRASDWVRSFENALGIPCMISFVRTQDAA